MTPLRTRRSRPRGPHRLAALAIAVIGLLAATQLVGVPVAAADRPARIFLGQPATLDPAVAGDAGSAAVIAQLFEGLTAIDPTLTPRPALAERWELRDDGRTVVFTLRDGLTFSDGSALSAADVRRSWLRVVDPAAPSPLASLLYDVVGARDYATAAAARTPSGCGPTAAPSRCA